MIGSAYVTLLNDIRILVGNTIEKNIHENIDVVEW